MTERDLLSVIHPESDDDLTVRVGEKLVLKGVTRTVTDLDVATLPRVRDRLIEVARARVTTTYGALKSDAELPHATNGLGRLLDLVGEDCCRRGEPSLASLVVTSGSGEVGSAFDGDPETVRSKVHDRWARTGSRARLVATPGSSATTPGPSFAAAHPTPALTDEAASSAFRHLDEALAASPLTGVLAGLEKALDGADAARAAEVTLVSGFDEDLIDSALVVRERVGILDTLIHAAVITQVIPLLLRDHPDEKLTKRPSLGAGNDPGRLFDLETNERVAEFKLSSWTGADSGRERSLFADVVGLSLDTTGRRREVYVVGPRPRTFLLTSQRNALKVLSKASLRVRTPPGMTESTTVAEYTATAGVRVIDLASLLPRLR